MTMKRYVRTVLACLVAGCGSSPVGAAEAAATAARPAILFLGGSVTEKALGDPDKYAHTDKHSHEYCDADEYGDADEYSNE